MFKENAIMESNLKNRQNKFWFRFCLFGLIVGSVLTAGCGNRVENHIRKLGGNADDRKTAMLELTMAKDKDVSVILQAVQDNNQPVAVRIDLITVLARLLFRGGNKEIYQVFDVLVHDPASDIRKAVIRELGDLQKEEGIKPLLAALKDADPEVQSEALSGLDKVADKIKADDRPGLMKAAGNICAKTKNNAQQAELHEKALDALESGAEKMAQQADKLALSGQLKEAETNLLGILALVPDSVNINYKLGRFYYDNDRKDKGLAMLEKHGLLLRLKKFAVAPAMDGGLSDPCWEQATRITNFYQCVIVMRARKISGKSEVRMGYTDEAIYIAYKAYEPSTKGIKCAARTRDGSVYADDCLEIFFDAKHDYKTFYQFCINALGTVYDSSASGNGTAWNPKVVVCPKVMPEVWTLEIKIPFKDMGVDAVASGSIFGFNVCPVRIGNLSEYGQWAPTYGSSQRPERFGFLLFE
jgi:hypothetical protein